MSGLLLMGESFLRNNPGKRIFLTAPGASEELKSWAKSRPQVRFSTSTPQQLTGWDVKPWLLLQQLEEESEEVIWLDADTIVTRPLSSILADFPEDTLLVAEEWDRHPPISVAHLWGWREARPIPPVNSCFMRAKAAHRPLLQQWLLMTRDAAYRRAQDLPFESRPWHLASDQALLTALLSSEQFADTPIEYVPMGRHLAQCAGSSGYRPLQRMLDLVRGLPTLIHCIGRKPWAKAQSQKGIQRFMQDLATDVSPYVLASRQVAAQIGAWPPWLDARTWLGKAMRTLTAFHPGLAGLPLAMMHRLQTMWRAP
jgi:hypothetical protein